MGKGEVALTDTGIVVQVAWMEGPTAAPDSSIYFSDVRGDRILRVTAAGELSTVRAPANFPNGMVFDPQGRLIVCECGDPTRNLPPRVTRTDLVSGAMEVLLESYCGLRLKAASDVTYDRVGAIWCTNDERPFFLPPYPTGGEVSTVGVYRISADGGTTRVLEAPDIRRPNGIALAPDDRTLYLIENDPSQDGIRQLLAFDIRDGRLYNKRVLVDFSPGRSGDGLAVDVQGNIYVAAGLNALRGTSETLATPAGIHIFSPNGDRLRVVRILEDSVTNLTFAGDDMRTVYVTAGKTLYSFRNDIPGLPR